MTLLAPHVLPKVEGLDDSTEDGHGAFGVVYKVTVNGVPCMAKRLHQILVREVSFGERTLMETKFINECELLSKLSHPNIVHFIGVHYGHSERDLALIMERLHTDVAAFVRIHHNIPISIKTSIMLDVSYGLLYLHNQTPPIIHRDLTAPNVLLTKDLRAKIADLGVSKVLTDPLLIKQTTAPGNVSYMAPETKTQNPVYGTSVDIFSAGHLIIHIAIQDWPKLFKVTNHLSVAPGQTEIAERQAALDEGMGKRHCMYDLAISCLHDDPKQRPSTAEFNIRLNSICMKNPKSFKDMCEIHSSEDGEECQGSQDRIIQLSEEVKRQQAEIEQLTRDKNDLSNKLKTQEIVASMYKDDFDLEREDRQRAHSNMVEMDSDFSRELQLLENELHRSKAKVEELHTELRRRSEDISQLQREKEELQQRLEIIDVYGQQQKRDGSSQSASSSLSFLSNSASTKRALSQAATYPPDSHSNESQDSEASRESTDHYPRSPVHNSPLAHRHDYVHPEREAQSRELSKYTREKHNNESASIADHGYVNLRDDSNDFRQRYAALASHHGGDPNRTDDVPITLVTPTDVDPQQALLRSRALTLSTPNLSSSSHYTDVNKETGRLSKLRSQTIPSGETSNLTSKNDFAGSDQHGIQDYDSSQLRRQHLDPLLPVPRQRSHAISSPNAPDLSDFDEPPSPPKRHQSLSRARSNPSWGQRQCSGSQEEHRHLYEHVPQRYDHSLSVPHDTIDRRRFNFQLPTSSGSGQMYSITPMQSGEHQHQPLSPSSRDSNRSGQKSQTPTYSAADSFSTPPNRVDHQNMPRHSSLDESTLPSSSQVDPQYHRHDSDPAPPPYENIKRVLTPSGNVQFQISRDEQAKPIAATQFSHRGNLYQHQEIKKHSLPIFTTQDSVDPNSIAPSSVRDVGSIGFAYTPSPETSRDLQRVKLASTRKDDSVDLPPLDPYLVCPTCAINFRVGEIQEFRKHALECRRIKEGKSSS